MKDKKNTKRKIIIAILLITIVLVILVTQIAMAKYKTAKNLNANLKIANPIFIVEGNESTKISAIQNTGYYEFMVKNYDEENVSETAFLYTIEVVSKTDESIEFELYKENEDENNKIPLNNMKTNELNIGANEKIEQKYKLKVTYDKNKGPKGKDILEEVQIKIHSEQEKIG